MWIPIAYGGVGGYNINFRKMIVSNIQKYDFC